MAYTAILVMSGPAKNAIRNTNILIHSINCGQELVTKQMKIIINAIKAPIAAMRKVIKDVVEALKNFARKIKNAFIAIRDMFLEILGAIKSAFKWLANMVKMCNNQYGSPYQRCNKSFQLAIDDCRKKMGIFKFVCAIVSVVQYVCNIARVVDALCALSHAIKFGLIKPLKEKFKQFGRNIYHEFYVNVSFHHYYNFSMEQSKSFKEIRGDIAQEIKDRTRWLYAAIDWSDFGMAFLLLFLIAKAHAYRIRYMTADHYDNVYITMSVQEIDKRRSDMKKETILPLTIREMRKYVETFSIRMAESERKQLVVAGSLLLVSGLQMGFYMLLDYCMYNFLVMIRSFFGIMDTKTQLPTVMKLQVSGEGVMADMFQDMLSKFDPMMATPNDLNPAKCLPTPIPLDLKVYQKIGFLYVLCVILALTESYGLRLRHVICGLYYPKRDKIRAVWLYNHILRTRGGLKTYLRRQIRRKFYGDESIAKVSFVERVLLSVTAFRAIAKAFGYVKQYCISCSEPADPKDTENFKRCETPGCKGIYCNDCFKEINNLCTLCMHPVEYGDVSDISEERDSSDEEEIQKEKLLAKMQGSHNGVEDNEFLKETGYNFPENGNERMQSVISVESQSKKELASIEDFAFNSEDET